MKSKNKSAQTAAERNHVAKVAELACVVCNESGPSEVHEPEQGLWWISVPLCVQCHRGAHGWHGSRFRWTLHKVDELTAINRTLERVYG